MTARTTTRIRLATVLFALTASATATARGGPIGSTFALSSSEAARPILLDGSGARIAVLRTPRGEAVLRPSDATPTYVAYRLDRSSELPQGFPTVNVGGSTPHEGLARGPLRLDTLAKSALDAELAKSGEAAVQMPRQAYYVASLPKLLGSSPDDATTQIWLASTAAGGAKARPAKADGTSLGDTLKGWFTASSNAIQDLNTQIADAIKRQLYLDPPKPVIYPAPKAKVQAATQVLAAPESIQAAPVPEPASLVVFAAALAAAALRARSGRKGNARTA
jgi:hypothetical protein